MPGYQCSIGHLALFEDGEVMPITSGSNKYFNTCQPGASVGDAVGGSGVITTGESYAVEGCQNQCCSGHSCLHPESGSGVLIQGTSNATICGQPTVPPEFDYDLENNQN